MLRRLTLLLFFLSFINAQIALPTFQGVHTPHSTTSSGTPENPAQSSGISTDYTNGRWYYLMGYRFTPQVDGTITQLIGGNSTMPNQDGGTMTGRNGNGLITIVW